MKKKNFSLYFGISLLILCSVHSFGQSPWLVSPKDYYVQFSYTLIPSYNQLHFIDQSVYETSRSVVDQTLQLYGEYGISDKFALTASIPVKLLSTGEINPNYIHDAEDIPDAAIVNELGNVQLSLKYKLLNTKWVSALQLTAELPAYAKKAEETGLYPGYDAFSLAPLASFGRGWNKTYFSLWLSYIYRTNNFSDQFDTGIEGGWSPFNKFWFITYLNFRLSTTEGNKTPPPPAKQLGLYPNYQEYSAFGLKFLYETELKNTNKLGFIAHLSGAFAGQLVARAPLFSLGVYIKK